MSLYALLITDTLLGQNYVGTLLVIVIYQSCLVSQPNQYMEAILHGSPIAVSISSLAVLKSIT